MTDNPNTRRKFLQTATTVAAIGISGCVTSGELVDTTYNCEIEQPETEPNHIRPEVGNPEAKTTLSLYHDYTDRPSKLLIDDIYQKLQDEYIQTGDLRLKFYNTPTNQDSDWFYQLGSIDRYIYEKTGSDGFEQFFTKIYNHHPEISWQLVGDIAADIDLEPCTTIAHGSWKTYEEILHTDYAVAIDNNINTIPNIQINGEKVDLHSSSPISESYSEIRAKIENYI